MNLIVFVQVEGDETCRACMREGFPAILFVEPLDMDGGRAFNTPRPDALTF